MSANNYHAHQPDEVQHVPSRGYFINFGTVDTASRFDHIFCGEHTIRGAACPNCSKPLLRYVGFDVRDLRLGLAAFPSEKLNLFYCWTCNMSQEPLFYLCQRNGDIQLLHFGKGGKSTDFPYPNYPRFFPQREIWLEEIPPEVQLKISLLNQNRGAEADDIPPALAVPRHQVGGIPLLVQPLLDLHCPQCNKRMALFSSFGDDTGGERGFTGNPFVQVLFHLCSSCAIVGAYQQCD